MKSTWMADAHTHHGPVISGRAYQKWRRNKKRPMRILNRPVLIQIICAVAVAGCFLYGIDQLMEGICMWMVTK